MGYPYEQPDTGFRRATGGHCPGADRRGAIPGAWRKPRLGHIFGESEPPISTSLVVALVAPASSERDRAWDAFIASYTPLLLGVARAVCRDHDTAMDAYAHVIERLRENDCARVRGYQATPGCSFETWLGVVARRLCVDHLRHRYGRDRTLDPDALEERRRLADLVAAAIDVDQLPGDGDPASAFDQCEMLAALDDVLAQLDARDRLLLRYRFDDELSAREIARLMDMPSMFHAYRRVNAVLARLKEALRGRGVGPHD